MKDIVNRLNGQNVPRLRIGIKQQGIDMSAKFVSRTKNFFALGVLYYMYDRPLEATEKWLKKKFAGKDTILSLIHI